MTGRCNYAAADPEDPDEVKSEVSFEETMGALTAELDKEIKIQLAKVGFEL